MQQHARVLFITRKFPPAVGGMEEFSVQLSSHLTCYKRVIAMRGSQLNLIWFFPYALVYALVHARTYDVLHLGDAVLCGIGWAPRWLLRKRVVITAHGLDVSYHLWLYRVYLRLFFRSDVVACVSGYTQAIVSKLFPAQRAIVIPNGALLPAKDATDAELATYRQSLESRIGRSLESISLVTSVGRLVPRKGFAWFVSEVMPLLPTSTVFLIGGSGPERAHIANAIAAHHLESRVFLLGQITADEMRLFFGLGDVFVMPNQPSPEAPEGFGIVALEAGNAGMTVVASRLEGITEAIHHEENGLLVTHDDVTAWVRAIEQVLAAGKSGDMFQARTYNAAHFSWSAIAAHYEQIYDSLM